jgi:hypothetical protein
MSHLPGFCAMYEFRRRNGDVFDPEADSLTYTHYSVSYRSGFILSDRHLRINEYPDHHIVVTGFI